jgi:hypothetical protein
MSGTVRSYRPDLRLKSAHSRGDGTQVACRHRSFRFFQKPIATLVVSRQTMVRSDLGELYSPSAGFRKGSPALLLH